MYVLPRSSYSVHVLPRFPPLYDSCSSLCRSCQEGMRKKHTKPHSEPSMASHIQAKRWWYRLTHVQRNPIQQGGMSSGRWVRSFRFEVLYEISLGCNKVGMLPVHTDTNPWGRLNSHLQSPGWLSILCVAWCLIWWFTSIARLVIHDTVCSCWNLDSTTQNSGSIVKNFELIITCIQNLSPLFSLVFCGPNPILRQTCCISLHQYDSGWPRYNYMSFVIREDTWFVPAPGSRWSVLIFLRNEYCKVL